MEKNPVYLDFDNLYTKREEKTHNSWQFTVILSSEFHMFRLSFFSNNRYYSFWRHFTAFNVVLAGINETFTGINI